MGNGQWGKGNIPHSPLPTLLFLGDVGEDKERDYEEQ